MKKLICIFTVLLSIFFLAACSSEPTQIDKAQSKIVEIGNQFLNYDLTADEAREKLDNILIPETEGIGSLNLKIARQSLSYLILKTKTFNPPTFEEIQEEIKDIESEDYND